MGVVVIQPRILVSKLKNQDKVPSFTGNLNSIKTYVARFIANSSSCTKTELSKGPLTL